MLPLRMPARRPNRAVTLRAIPTRQWAGRLGFVFLLTLAVALFALGRANNGTVANFRAGVNDVLVPVVDVVSKPVDAARDVKLWVSEMAGLRAENLALKSQVAQLMQWQSAATELRAENEALRKLIHVVPAGKVSYVAARIVGESGGPYVRSSLINGGLEDGIANEQAVVSAEGLVGRVVDAGKSSSRVLLITDINSRVPVISERSRERSIASGNNSDVLTLDYVESGSRMEPGERLLTSGDGGVFPPGIPVGVISAINGSIVMVQPLTDWNRMEYVSVVSYEF